MIRASIVLLLIAANCMAQQLVLDSLLQQYEHQEGEARVNTLINISRQLFISSDPKAIDYANEAISYANKIGYTEGVGKAMLFLGLSWADIEPDSALRYYLRSSEILTSLGHPWAHYGYKNASDIYINKGWYPEALSLVIKILELNQKTGDTLLIVESLSTLGYLHNSMENHNEALFWQRKALEALGDVKNDTRRGLILGRIGIVYDETGNYDSALYYNKMAIEYFRHANNNVYVAQWNSNLANTYIKLRNYSEAEKMLKEAMLLNTYDDRKPNIFNNLAKVYIETKRFALARQALDSAYYYATRFQLKDVESETWFRKYELQRAEGRINDALESYIRYSNLRDSILNIRKTEQVAQMLVRYQTEEKERALLFEKAENERIEKERAEAQLSRNRIQKMIWGLMFIALIIIMLVLSYLFKIKRRAQLEKNLAIIHEQEKSLAAIITAQEEERKRFAKDLHDGIGQQISAISLNFQVLERKLSGELPYLIAEVEKIKRMIFDASNEIRTVSHQMMPRALTQFGLPDALEDMLEISFRNTDIEYKFNHQNMAIRLPQDAEIGLYRVAQELISNVIKHSKARMVDIQLYRTDNECVLSVSDDGIGFDSIQSEGIGLTNISSRVNTLKGRFTVSSKPGNGTSAVVKLKIESGE